MFFSKSRDEFLIKRNVEIGSSKWKIKLFSGKIIYVLLLIFYIPFFILSVSTWVKLILSNKIKIFVNRDKQNGRGKLGIASRRHKITDMTAVDPKDELDFLVNRSFAYIWRMCFWTPQELTLFLLKEQKIKLISDGQLAYVVLCTVFGHSVRWDEERNMFRLRMDGLEDIQLFEGFCWDAREIFVSEDCKKIIIKMNEEDEYHSDCHPDERHNFDLAKLHAQVCLSFMGPGLSHNDVHFIFPSTMAVMSKQHLDHNGVLFKLLSPHFRFTERINFQALRVQKATNNKRSLDRLFFHWQPFPVTKEIFRDAIAKKCKEYYLVEGAKECEATEEIISSDENDARYENGDSDNTTESLNREKGKKSSKRTHMIFPPDFVTDKSRRKVPYLNFLYQYYKVIRRYVQDLSPFIDREEWKKFSSEVANYVPRFDKVEMVEAITSFILKVGVVHYCDHGSYTRYFAYPYACMSMRAPFGTLENEETWSEIETDLKITRDAVKLSPLALIQSQDVLRTRSFLNIFVDFVGNPDCDLFLPGTDYRFQKPGPRMAEKVFKKRLRELDNKLRAQSNIVPFLEPEFGEVRATGMQIEPLDEIVRSVCF
ncbi:uncharacterized protein LOC120345133 [Styela clava]